MNQVKHKDANSKAKRDPNGSRKEAKRCEKARRPAAGAVNSRNRPSGCRTVPDAGGTGDGSSRDSCGKTDSSSEMSDCASEEIRAADNELRRHAAIDNGVADAERAVDWEGEGAEMVDLPSNTPALGRAERSVSPPFTSMDGGWRFSASGALEFSRDGAHDDLLREIDDLRSENEYLK
ncbi:protein SOGA1-like, partial [Clarias magur]